MINIRRIYTYSVSLISLLALYFAFESLLQTVLLPGRRLSLDVAFQLATIIIAGPIYLGHWLWQQRRATADDEERADILRAIYLYLILSITLMAGITAIGDILDRLLRLLISSSGTNERLLMTRVGEELIGVALALAIWLYHWYLLREDGQAVGESEGAGVVRRIYIFQFAGTGLYLAGLGLGELLRWLLSLVGSDLGASLPAALSQLLVGLPVWLAFWLWAQRLFRTGAHERTSTLRRFYLYAVLFVGTVGTVTNVTLILAGILRALLGLRPEGDVRNVIAAGLAFGIVGIFHFVLLREEVAQTEDTHQQAEMRRLYLYLLAGTGLTALLAGVIGDITALLLLLDLGMDDVYREVIAYATASILVGLPVWALAWRMAQSELSAVVDTDMTPRQSLMRRIYLYLFLFVTILGVLGGAVFVVYSLISWLLNGASLELNEMATAIAIAVVTGVVWIFHLLVLQGDRRHVTQHQTRRLASARVVLLAAGGDASFSPAIDSVQSILPDVQIQVVPLSPPVDAGDPGADEVTPVSQPSLAEQLAGADVVLVPSSILLSTDADGDATDAGTSELRRLLATSPAQKLVLQSEQAGWHWLPVKDDESQQTTKQIAQAVEQLVSQGELKAARRFGCGALLALWLAISLLGSLVNLFMYGF